MKTDAQIKEDVTAELNWNPEIDATEIGVEVSHGVVTLSGHVGSFNEKLDAESAAQNVSGVQALAVAMKVIPRGSGRRDDAEIALAAKDALQWLSELMPHSIKVMSEKGWVTLSGEVTRQHQQAAAIAAVRHLKGVIGVYDHITVQAHSESKSIQMNIESALKRSTLDNSEKILVQVIGADVILSGVIDNWEERSLVKQSAWAAPGVNKVVDNMTLAF